ncbi:MAG: cyclic pyranopterin monophosphate synthase MoaC, partial [Alphaproteobacteria bacterium]|nr:cyclic pyranopterin monophosphate synthase MoaC [Alphaproteobacteria bacterium]
MSGFTHFDDQGDAVMVDISDKDITSRTATATGSIFMETSTLELITSHG